MPYGVILAAGVVSGLALWCSNGVLERVTQDDRIVRVALLPPLWVALACCVVAIGAIGALVHLVSRVGQRHAPAARPDASLADLCLPLFATATLVTPYLPHLADWFPALTLLAGPFKGVVWTVVVVLVARAALLRAGASVTPRLSRRVSAMLVFLAGLALYSAAASRLVQTALFPGGDEPHYLVIAQSLWRDGDLRIEDNHRRGDTLEYFNLPLTPHYLTRGKDREIYSIHPIGLAVAAAPIYALGGYLGVVAALVIVAALAGALAWRLARRWTASASATVGWLACAAGAPSVFNSFTVYPEVPAALATIAAFGLVTRLDTTTAPARLALGCGVALATLPWLSSKYVAMAGVMGLLAILRLWPSPASRLRSLALLAVVPIVSLALWFAFFQAIWGTPSPSAPYGSQDAMSLGNLAAGAPGLFFDQEYGVVAIGPALILALAGLGWMLTTTGTPRRLAIEILLVIVALLVPVGAFHQWWGGSAAAGRPLIAALLLLTVPIAWFYERSGDRPALRAAAWLLVAGSLSMVATLALAQQGLLLAGERDGTSRLLNWWSPGWPLAAVAPSFVAQPTGLAATEAALWLVALTVAFLGLALMRRQQQHGRAGLAAFAAATLALGGVTVAVPRVPGRDAVHDRDLSQRAQSNLLAAYDRHRRPIGIVFDPFHAVDAASVVPMVQFTAGPAAREGSTGVPLLHGARWSLPAGDYRVELTASDRSQPLVGELGLQLGRRGGPIETWQVEPAAHWATTFTLPVTVGFVGLRASDQLAAQRPLVRLTPLRITSRRDRLGEEEVLESRDVGGATLFIHDGGSYLERSGIWLKANARSRLTLAATSRGPGVMRLRAGPAATQVDLRIDGRQQTVSLEPGQGRDIPLPAGGTRRIEFVTRGGFVPAEVEPTNTDTRQLACWIELAAS